KWGKARFEELFPLHKIPLAQRKDKYGKQVAQKERELHDRQRERNRPPTFIVAWTRKTSGNHNMPHTWIMDHTNSADTASHLKKQIQSNKPSTSCTGTCTDGHVCCPKRTNCNMKFDSNSLLITEDGVRPCGIDGKSIPRFPHETANVRLEACGSNCACGIDCPNRVVERGPQKMVIIFATVDKGWSIRTCEKLVRGEYIFSFTGHHMMQPELLKSKQNEAMFFNLTPRCGVVDLEATGARSVITITTDIGANEFKYTNHSCGPNSLIVCIYHDEHDAHFHLVSLFARQTLQAFDEITYDYYTTFDTFMFNCLCGSYACRGMAENYYLEDKK
ncbi:hypothetical protein PFISCL1PPCAC_28078, partial [Pristionchus fissidentatus]